LNLIRMAGQTHANQARQQFKLGHYRTPGRKPKKEGGGKSGEELV
jgi:hypothetical protein